MQYIWPVKHWLSRGFPWLNFGGHLRYSCSSLLLHVVCVILVRIFSTMMGIRSWMVIKKWFWRDVNPLPKFCKTWRGSLLVTSDILDKTHVFSGSQNLRFSRRFFFLQKTQKLYNHFTKFLETYYETKIITSIF